MHEYVISDSMYIYDDIYDSMNQRAETGAHICFAAKVPFNR